MKKEKPFDKWTEEEIQIVFGLEKIENPPSLNDWLSTQYILPDYKQIVIEGLCFRLQKNYAYWTQNELIIYFIAPFLSLVDYWGYYYHTFNQVFIQHRVEGINMHGQIATLLSHKNKQIGVNHFFILHYQTIVKKKYDGLGQILAAMLTAQTINKHNYALLGCFVVGNNWQFVVLLDNKYAVSPVYIATNPEDLLCIYAALDGVKLYVKQQMSLIFKQNSHKKKK